MLSWKNAVCVPKVKDFVMVTTATEAACGRANDPYASYMRGLLLRHVWDEQ